MSGFVAVHREATKHPLFKKDAARFGAFIWLVSMACWKPTKFDISGAVVTLERGQLCASRAQLSEAWGWSPSAVERFLTRLETEQMIGRATGQGRTIITICNYGKYQEVSKEAGQATGQATGQRSDSHRTTKEPLNHGTKEQVNEDKPHSQRAKRGLRLQADWMPNRPYPQNVQALVDQWPEGREWREFENFRDYWTSRTKDAAKLDWNKTWHNRIRDQHDRIIAQGRNANGNGRQTDRRDGAVAALQRQLGLDDTPGPFGRSDFGGGEGNRRILPPDPGRRN